MTQTVTAPDGTVHNFPDEATPEMIAAALGVALPDAPAPSGVQGAINSVTGYLNKRHDVPFADNPIVDVPLSGASGVVTGATELGMLPYTAARAVDDYLVQPTIGRVASAGVAGVDYVAQRAAKALGLRTTDPQGYGDIYDKVQGAQRPDGLAQAQDKFREARDAVLYQPRTGYGKVAKTVGEFAPGGMALGTGATKTARFVGDTLIPALSSEAAGRVAEGSDYEGIARFLGAIFGSGAVGSVRNSRLMGPERVIKGGLPNEGLTPEQWDAAIAKQRLAADKLNFGLTGQEAIDAATGGGSTLSNVMRVVDNSQPGGAISKPFYAERIPQTDDAVAAVADSVGASVKDPYVTGPKMATAADSVLQDMADARNATTTPLYRAAAPVKVEPDITVPTSRTSPIIDPNTGLPMVVAGTKTVPAPLGQGKDYAEAVAWVRENVKGMKSAPENSAAMADYVSRRLLEKAKIAAAPGDSFSNLKASQLTDEAMPIRENARTKVPEYDAALKKQAELYAKEDAAKAGPIGRVANAKTTEGVVEALFPAKPLADSNTTFSEAVAKLSAKDKESLTETVLQALKRPYAAAKNVRGPFAREQTGSRFANAIAGNPDQKANLLSAVEQTVGGTAAKQDVTDLLDVLDATSYRPNSGSNTQPGTVIQKTLENGGGLANFFADTAKTGGFNIPGKIQDVRDATKQIWYGNNIARVAEMNTSPDSVAQFFRPIAENRFVTPQPDGVEAIRKALIESINPAARAAPQLRERKPLRIDITEADRKKAQGAN